MMFKSLIAGTAAFVLTLRFATWYFGDVSWGPQLEGSAYREVFNKALLWGLVLAASAAYLVTIPGKRRARVLLEQEAAMQARIHEEQMEMQRKQQYIIDQQYQELVNRDDEEHR